MKSRRIVPMNLFAGKKWRHRCREWTCENGAEEREGGMYGEANVETYGMIYKIDSQCEFAV